MDPFGIHEPRLTNSRAFWLILCSSSKVIQVYVLFTSRPSKLCAATLPNGLGSPYCHPVEVLPEPEEGLEMPLCY